VVHTCNPSNQEAEAGGWRVRASLAYKVSPCLKKEKKEEKKKKRGGSRGRDIKKYTQGYPVGKWQSFEPI
jgi:hypothetical protein